MKYLLVMVQNVIQWYSIRPFVEYINKKGLPFEVVVYNPGADSGGFIDIAESVMRIIRQDGFMASYTPRHKRYQVCLSPYSNMAAFIDSKFKLGYCYGAITTKPAVTFLPVVKKGFHGFLIHDSFYEEVYGAYARTYIVPDLYLPSIRHHKPGRKPVVLYLPTYHEPGVLKVAMALRELKDEFYIITKGHHGTDFLGEESAKKEALASFADEHYDSNQYVIPLFEKADVVLSDNSGAIFDALYGNIPVAIATERFCDELNGILSPQETFARNGVIPFTHELDAENIRKTIMAALSDKQRRVQKEASDVLFPKKSGGAESWWKVVEKYWNDQVEQNYRKMHNYLEEHYAALEEKTRSLEEKCNALIAENNLLKTKLCDMEKEKGFSKSLLRLFRREP